MVAVFATRNAHKAEEVAAILRDTDITLRTLDALEDLPEDIPETGDTFEANALQKARFVYERTGLLTIADDSGLEVDALGGGPGVHSKRFSAEATAATNNVLLLDRLDGVPDEERGCRFRCVVAVVGPAGDATAEGRCEGRVGHADRGESGFGYDPLFDPVETPGRSMAQLTMDEKNAISHRGRAFRQLPDLLASLGG